MSAMEFVLTVPNFVRLATKLPFVLLASMDTTYHSKQVLPLKVHVLRHVLLGSRPVMHLDHVSLLP